MGDNVDPRFEMLCKQSVEDARKIAKLEHENERLRAALREIIGIAVQVDVDAAKRIKPIILKARTALGARS